jgi:hypothetical protein
MPDITLASDSGTRIPEPGSPVGKYIYCIIDSDVPESFGPIGIGGKAASGVRDPSSDPSETSDPSYPSSVTVIGLNGIGAVVSDSTTKEYQHNRDNLIAHERAIETVMKTHTVLPARFSTVADDEGMVTRILAREHDRFIVLLTEIKGKLEVGLKAVFEETVGCQEILEKHRPIRELKAKIARLPPQRSYYQRIEIGRMVESALKQEKDSLREEILTALSPLALDVKTNAVWNDKMILNAAFLIEQPKAGDFDQRVEQLAGRYGEKLQFKLVGTVPPFNFVDLVIDTREYRREIADCRLPTPGRRTPGPGAEEINVSA